MRDSGVFGIFAVEVGLRYGLLAEGALLGPRRHSPLNARHRRLHERLFSRKSTNARALALSGRRSSWIT